MPEPEANENETPEAVTPETTPESTSETAPIGRPSAPIGRLDGVPDGTNVRVNIPLEYEEGAPEHPVSDGDFGTKMWGSVLCYQCHYCPWDSPSVVNDEEIGLERMVKHIALAHPLPRGEAKYDDLGERIRTK